MHLLDLRSHPALPLARRAGGAFLRLPIVGWWLGLSRTLPPSDEALAVERSALQARCRELELAAAQVVAERQELAEQPAPVAELADLPLTPAEREVACPRCGAAAGSPCRTLAGGRSRRCHRERADALRAMQQPPATPPEPIPGCDGEDMMPVEVES